MADSSSPVENRSDDNNEIQPAATGNGRAADSSPSSAGSDIEIRRRRRNPEEDIAAFDDVDNAEQEEEDGEDLFGDDMLNDYRQLEQFDNYEVDPEAEAADVANSPGARRRAERALRQRDQEEGRGLSRHLSGAAGLNVDDSDEEESGIEERRRRRRRRRLASQVAASEAGNDGEQEIVGFQDQPMELIEEGRDEEDEDENLEGPFELENVIGPLREYVKQARPRREIVKRFYSFLREHTDEKTKHLTYMERIRIMGANNSQSLVVNYSHLSSAEPYLAIWTADAPQEMLDIYNEVATSVTKIIFPDYERIHPEIFVRIAGLPICDNIRDIRHIHLNTLVKVTGVVTRRSGVFPHLRIVKLNCEKCNTLQSPNTSTAARPEKSITICEACGSKGPFTINSEQTLFGNFQKMNLQESPGTVPAGRLPRYKEVVLLNDLIDCARPGDAVELTGIYRHNIDPSINITHGFPVFSTVLEANYVQKVESSHAETFLTDDDVIEIRQLAKDPKIADRLFASMAPSIYGHSDIKRALALALFGGQAKEVGEKHRIRGDINILMMGDPGTAKSQFLKYVEKTASRAVYTTGKGASAVGLTAGVHRDPVTREWTLEGGALVLADRGVCLIDEFDKMNDADRTSIHEAMEQQSISISKAGIVTTLQARCSVFAAANPIKGRYDPSISFYDNVDLTEPILSRFDVLCVVRDKVDATQDETLAKFVVDSHMASHPDRNEEEGDITGEVVPELSDGGVEVIPQDLFRKYILYSRRNIHPKLTNMDKDKISALYIDLRRESMASGGMPIALRHLESIVRLAEAHARLHLREYVRDDDVNAAISVMLESFFTSQKYAVMRGLRRHFHKYLSYRKDDHELLFYVLSGLVRDYSTTQAVSRSHTMNASEASQGSSRSRRISPNNTVEVDMEDFEARAREMGVHSCESFYNSRVFSQRKFSVDQERSKIIRRL